MTTRTLTIKGKVNNLPYTKTVAVDLIRPAGIWFGSTSWYEADSLTSEQSWDKLSTAVGGGRLKFFHGYSGNSTPANVAGSGELLVCESNNVAAMLNVKTDWKSNVDSDPYYWAARVKGLVQDWRSRNPTKRLILIVDHEPENDTTDPTTNSAAAQLEAARWRTGVLTIFRAVWGLNDPLTDVSINMMGYNSQINVNTGGRVSKWLAPVNWNPNFTVAERAKVLLMGNVYPKVDVNGNLSQVGVVKQDLTSQSKVLDDYATLGYSRFGYGEFGFNTDACGLTKEDKVRDLIRGYQGTAEWVGSLGWYLRNTTHKVEVLSWFNRKFTTPDATAGAYCYLTTSETKLSGFRELVDALG